MNQSSVEEKSIQKKALKLTEQHANATTVDRYLKRYRLLQVVLATVALFTFVGGGAFLKLSQYLRMDLHEPGCMLALGVLLGGIWMNRVIHRELYFTPLSTLPALCHEVEVMARLSASVLGYVRTTLALRPLRTFDVARMNVLFHADEAARNEPGPTLTPYERLAAL